ncbi:hypothetical protein CYMTET_26855 [Cymbomonas tetramitiformis]|uniref:Uncharacterized protein n=1 Tax=Cymbomonas tetramitiformis TaxID=36881 RepID=A0AAE0KXI2_9CHLO|nr:hypothetical protein CYMTET_26855 [Cymbomonas tetramitiformis]
MFKSILGAVNKIENFIKVTRRGGPPAAPPKRNRPGPSGVRAAGSHPDPLVAYDKEHKKTLPLIMPQRWLREYGAPAVVTTDGIGPDIEGRDYASVVHPQQMADCGVPPFGLRPQFSMLACLISILCFDIAGVTAGYGDIGIINSDGNSVTEEPQLHLVVTTRRNGLGSMAVCPLKVFLSLPDACQSGGDWYTALHSIA